MRVTPPNPIPVAERKLDAARFFLDELETASDSPRAFYYYASALLSAARSVDYALRHEVGDSYREWLALWRASLSETERMLSQDLIGLRNADVHGEDTHVSLMLDVGTISSDSAILHFTGTGLKSARMAEIWDELPRATLPKRAGLIVDLTYHFVRGGATKDLLDACRRFVEIAARLLHEFRSSTSDG